MPCDPRQPCQATPLQHVEPQSSKSAFCHKLNGCGMVFCLVVENFHSEVSIQHDNNSCVTRGLLPGTMHMMGSKSFGSPLEKPPKEPLRQALRKSTRPPARHAAMNAMMKQLIFQSPDARLPKKRSSSSVGRSLLLWIPCPTVTNRSRTCKWQTPSMTAMRRTARGARAVLVLSFTPKMYTDAPF